MINEDTRTGNHAQVADDYTAIWSEPDVGRRRAAIARVWAADGVEFVEGAQFRGHDELHARVAHAYAEFVGSGRYLVTRTRDLRSHGRVVDFTLELRAVRTGTPAWSARVFLVLDENGRVREDYQLTVQPLSA